MASPPVPIRHYIRPYWGRLAFGVALLLATNGLDKAIPWLLKEAVDGLHQGDLQRVRDLALAVVAIAGALWFVRARSRIQIFNVGRDVEFDLRNELMASVHRLGPSFFGTMPTGQVMSRATNDLGQVRLLVGFAGLNVVNSVFAFTGAIALMLTISPELTAWALLPYPLMVLIARSFGRRIYTRSRDAQEALGVLSDAAQENVTGVRVVRAYAIEDEEIERFEVANRDAVRRNMRLVVLRGFMWPLLSLIGSIATLLVIWKGGEMFLADRLSIGQLAAFQAYVVQLLWPTLAFGYLLSVLQRGRASYARVREVLDAEPEVEEPEAPIPLKGAGALQVRGLSFSYGDRKVLDDVSFEVPARGSLAVMGTLGSGKSTLASLLPRLAPTPRGAVFVDGVDVVDVELAELRHAVGYAPQEPFLFSTTIERNISFGLEDPLAPGAHALVRRASEEACVLDEIEQLPDGFQTLVGERGVQLSGGQKQRVALARALLNEPRILVLDDPLSAVDARTEATILEALERAGADRTLLLVTHRVAAAARCDRIVVLDSGRVVEEGTHAELCAAGGRYSRLALRQQLEAELAGLTTDPGVGETAP